MKYQLVPVASIYTAIILKALFLCSTETALVTILLGALIIDEEQCVDKMAVDPGGLGMDPHPRQARPICGYSGSQNNMQDYLPINNQITLYILF